MDIELLPPQMLGFVSSAKHRAAALGAVMVVVMSLRDGSLRGAAPVLGLPPLKQPRAHLGLWDVWLCPDVTKKKKKIRHWGGRRGLQVLSRRETLKEPHMSLLCLIRSCTDLHMEQVVALVKGCSFGERKGVKNPLM